METITKDLSYKDLVHLVREEADAGKALEQQFSAFLMLQPFISPHAVVTPIINYFCNINI